MHPIRARILDVLARRELTTRQIAAELPDISQASVYRHARLLADAGLLRVVREVPVRGLMERVYAFELEAAYLLADEMAAQTPADFLRYFQVFVNALLDQYRLYSNRPDADPLADGVSFRGTVQYLTKPERDALVAELQEVLQKRSNNGPAEGRLRYHISRILIPDKGVPEDADD